MADRDGPESRQSHPSQHPSPAADAARCDPAGCDPATPTGPVREAGGTTGAGNLSPGQADRTGGATSGVGTDSQRPARAGQVPPSA